MYTTTISEKAKGYLAILTTTFLYGWFGVFVKIIGDSMPIFFQSLSRNVLIASVLLILLISTQKGIRIPQKADVLKIFARSIFGFINITTALIAFQKLSIGLVYILFFSGLLLGSFAIGTIYNKHTFRTSLIHRVS